MVAKTIVLDPNPGVLVGSMSGRMYSVSKKSCPYVKSKHSYKMGIKMFSCKMGQDFLDIQYCLFMNLVPISS